MKTTVSAHHCTPSPWLSTLKKFSIFSLLALSAVKGYSQKSSDSTEIVHLLQKESNTWRMGDLQGHADCWQQRPYSRVLASTPDGNTIDIPIKTMINPPENIFGNGGLAVHSNYRLSINGASAWVNHDEVSITKEGKESLSYEMRILEKVNGNWKLVGQSAHHFLPEDDGMVDTTSYIQTVDIESGQIETLLTINDHFEAPNWHPDNYLILNSKGKIHTLELSTKKMSVLNTGFADQCNNDHGLSPDHQMLAISHNDKNDQSDKLYKSAIYVLPVKGGEPRRITDEVMSFWHGWSPDGKRLAFCGERNGNFDIYTIPVKGGKEKRLTTTEGLDDGPEYSPDGKYIYFNSYRSGHMQIWRMDADGANSEQLTSDENSNWFAHPSPDGKWIVYIAYTSDQKQDHLFGKQVKLRLMNLETRAIKDITPVFYGGQGTINVPSWSPDSKKVAFVSYSVN